MGWLWLLIHIDDLVVAVLVGLWSWLTHSERYAAGQIHGHLHDLPDKVGKGRFIEGAADKRYVVFSDHHLLWRGARHDYVSLWRNRDMYARVLDHYYGQEDWVLVDNGDVEDLVLIKPGAWDNLGQLLVDTLPFSGLLCFAATFSRRRKQRLQRILRNYAGHYEQVRAFWQAGRFVKLSGNHETYLRQQEFMEILGGVLGPRPTEEGTEALRMHDFLVIPPPDGTGRAVVVCHGHQFDPWTNPYVAKCVGEAFTRFKGWSGNGGDRIWLREWDSSYDTPWWPRVLGDTPWGFGNVLAPGPWMRFTKPSKFLHLSERAMFRALSREPWTEARPMPKLVIGHTHEIRLDPWVTARGEERWEGYANSGSAGRFQDLIFCVEVEGGALTLCAWCAKQPGGQLQRIRFHPDDDQRTLVPDGGSGPVTV